MRKYRRTQRKDKGRFDGCCDAVMCVAKTEQLWITSKVIYVVWMTNLLFILLILDISLSRTGIY